MSTHAITGKTRLASSADIPTADEAGLSASLLAWYGLGLPEGHADGSLSQAQRHHGACAADPRVKRRSTSSASRSRRLVQQSPEPCAPIRSEAGTRVADYQGGKYQGRIEAASSASADNNTMKWALSRRVAIRVGIC